MIHKLCQRCGSRFRCESDRDCWCETVPIHRAQMVEIMEHYTDCLCPECLRLHIAKD